LRDYGVPGQLGLEPTPEEYVAKMVTVFREVKRVLRDDGTLWLNLGDSYAGSGKGPAGNLGTTHNERWLEHKHSAIVPNGLKPKDLVGIPWRVAFALQADGWYLRSDIIWHKPNPMPESVTDRPTKAHEYIFLMSKRERYYYDGESIKETASPDTHARYARGRSDHHKWADGGPGNQTIAKSFEHMRKPGVNPKAAMNIAGSKQNESFSNAVKDIVENRNKRTVWTVATHPYPEAHFATFPPELIKPCIKAGCPEQGIVLDPFMGSGTTAEVCCNHGRQYIGIELNPEYIVLAQDRIDRATRQQRLFI